MLTHEMQSAKLGETDCQEVNCPEGAREATLGCGPNGPRNDMSLQFYAEIDAYRYETAVIARERSDRGNPFPLHPKVR